MKSTDDTVCVRLSTIISHGQSASDLSEQRAAPPTQPKVRTRHGGDSSDGSESHSMASSLPHTGTHTHKKKHACTHRISGSIHGTCIDKQQRSEDDSPRVKTCSQSHAHTHKNIKTKSSSREQGVFAEITFKERVMHNTMAAQGNIKGPLRVSHPRVSKSLGLYLIKIVSAWYNKRWCADEKHRGDVRNVPGPKAAETERPSSQTCLGHFKHLMHPQFVWWRHTWLLTSVNYWVAIHNSIYILL